MSETNKTNEQLKEEFIKNRGYWSKFWEDVLELDSNFFSTYSKFSSVPSGVSTHNNLHGGLIVGVVANPSVK